METPQAQILKDITRFLDKNKIPYMITGSWSSIYYGRPRASHDIDFVVELGFENTGKTIEIFSKLPKTFMIQTESIEEAIKNKSQFQILHLSTMLKMDFWILTGEEFDKKRFFRRKRIRLFNQYMEMATPEDTIIQKLIWFSKGEIEKHLIDAAFVLQIQGKKLDRKYLSKWISKLKLKKYFEMLKKINLEDYL